MTRKEYHDLPDDTEGRSPQTVTPMDEIDARFNEIFEMLFRGAYGKSDDALGSVRAEFRRYFFAGVAWATSNVIESRDPLRKANVLNHGAYKFALDLGKGT